MNLLGLMLYPLSHSTTETTIYFSTPHYRSIIASIKALTIGEEEKGKPTEDRRLETPKASIKTYILRHTNGKDRRQHLLIGDGRFQLSGPLRD